MYKNADNNKKYCHINYSLFDSQRAICDLLPITKNACWVERATITSDIV